MTLAPHALLPSISNEWIASGCIALLAILSIMFFSALSDRIILNDRPKLRSTKTAIRNAVLIITSFLLVGVWLTELKTFALSVATISAALVITFREPLTSLIGGLTTFARQNASIGDNIEINSIKGEVIDKTLLSTIILESTLPGRYSQTILHIPNHWFLSYPLKNMGTTTQFKMSSFTILVSRKKDVSVIQEALLNITHEVLYPFLDEAQKAVLDWDTKHILHTITGKINVTFNYSEKDVVGITVEFPVRYDHQETVKQAILQRIHTFLQEI